MESNQWLETKASTLWTPQCSPGSNDSGCIKKSKEQQSSGDAAASAMLWSMGASAVSALMTKTQCTAATVAAAHEKCKEQQSTGRNSGYGIALVPLLTVW